MDELEIYGPRKAHCSLYGEAGYTRALKMVGAATPRKKHAVVQRPIVAVKTLYVMIRQSYQNLFCPRAKRWSQSGRKLPRLPLAYDAA